MDAGSLIPAPHTPVLYQEIIDNLAPQDGKQYLDCTAGAGGHSRLILESSSPTGELLALDLDPVALALAKTTLAPFGSRARVREGSYLNAAAYLLEIGWEAVDGIVMDLGVSSMQLDLSEKGFSFREPGPLDMRFSPTSDLTAEKVVNSWPEADLAEILWKYGEERFSRRIARAIVHARPITDTAHLAEIIRKAAGPSRDKLDPATRSFQGIRIAVNQELQVLEHALPKLIGLLRPKGRIAVISFHSLEDRLVKQAFRFAATDCICPPEQPVCTCGHKASLRVITPRPILPTEEGKRENPRARSAKLRVAEKL